MSISRNGTEQRIIGACCTYMIEAGLMPCADLPKRKFSNVLADGVIELCAERGIPADDPRIGTLADELAARIPRFKPNPTAKRGGGYVYYSVPAVEKFLRSRTTTGGVS